MTESQDEYSRRDQRTHLYIRPGMYIGHDEPLARDEWLFDVDHLTMVKTRIDTVPALCQIFLEVLTNASDNVAKSRAAGIEPGPIYINMSDNMISVKNGGRVIPIEMHLTEGVYNPELCFGTLLTSSEYTGDRQTAGTNGIGAKATNVFSKQFAVIIFDPWRHLKYTQVWNDNMLATDGPIIESYDGTDSSTEVIYEADFARFGYAGGYTDHAYGLFARFAVDVSFASKVRVYFNDQLFHYYDIRSYGALYFGSRITDALVHYEWAAGARVRDLDGYQIADDGITLPVIELMVVDAPDTGYQVSFVNGLMTKSGGVHVLAALKAIGKDVLSTINESKIKKLQKQSKTGTIDSAQRKLHTVTLTDISPHIFLLLSYRVLNPKHGSQTKEALQSPRPTINISPAKLGIIKRWDLITRLEHGLKAKQYKLPDRVGKRKQTRVGLVKGVDANSAGHKTLWSKCTLYISEGVSGAGYVSILLSLVQNGRDFIGVLPMRGKGLNVMKASESLIGENKEIIELQKALGLGPHYSDYTKQEVYQTLRYGSLMIMADSDDDGKHIIGLLLCFFHCRYPSLLKIGYVKFYRTPIIRAWHGPNTHKFYTHGAYQQWQAATPTWQSYRHKYYKGLGSSLDEEVADDLKAPRIVRCIYDDSAPAAMALAFSPTQTEARKDWIREWKCVFGIEDIEMLPISRFINEEMILFSCADMVRSIPKLTDGFKNALTKVIYGAHTRWKIGKLDKTYDEAGVARFGHQVAHDVGYHHNESILNDVIVAMAQDFVSSNNIPWFKKIGQFGSRYEGGKDAAAPRYIKTVPQPLMPYILRREDQCILKSVIDEGQNSGPETYYPIIPMILVNGANGVATGFSTTVPNHNPLDIVKWIRLYLAGTSVEDLPELVPWYRGFTGELVLIDRNTVKKRAHSTTVVTGEPDAELATAVKDVKLSLVTRGIYTVQTDGTIIVTELPIGKWSKTYHKDLEKLTLEKQISGYRDLSVGDKVYFEIYGYKGPISYKHLKLSKAIGMSNMTVLMPDGRPQRFSNSEELMLAFCEHRFAAYTRRKSAIIKQTLADIEYLHHKLRFTTLVNEKQFKIRNRTVEQMKADLIIHSLPLELTKITNVNAFTAEHIVELQQQIHKRQAELQEIETTEETTTWLRELDQFETKYRKIYKDE
jgi:DNA topoisomerase-2